MTAVLPATDALRRDRHMSLDDNHISYSTSSTDWRAKYNEVADMLAETRAELDDFHHASKELEAELESELQRTEKAQQDLKVKVARAESERDEWKGKFMSLQTNHNTTTTSLQRELDKLRQELQQTRVQLRDLEMGNDDLERNERAVSSSLADMETKYSRALEEKILLEHELLEKASLEEESQRLRDELRDANVEISILRDQVTAAHSHASLAAEAVVTPCHTSSSHFPHISVPSDDDLLNTPPPPDFHLSELSPSSESLPLADATPKGQTSSTGQSALLRRAGFQYSNLTPTSSPNSSARSSNLLSYSPSTPRTPSARPPTVRNPSSMSVTTMMSTTSKSKGVQMVSEMRARVRNLEQKIHTRVPRLRMGSITGRPNPNSLVLSSVTNSRVSSSSSSSSKGSTAKTSWESLSHRRSADSRQSNESDSGGGGKGSGGDSSGWVLIMEDSPSPPKEKEKERRRISSPSAPTSFRPTASTSIPSPTFGSSKASTLGQSTMGIRRPQSRLSAGSLSTAPSSSIPTPASRPATPTFLPIPSGGLYAHSSTAGMTGLKRSTGPGGANPYTQTKRSSLGSTTGDMPPPSDGREGSTIKPPHTRPTLGTPSSASSKYGLENSKALPQIPGLHTNITMRAPSKLPSTSSVTSSLAQSRIGRPSGGLSGRKSTDNGDLGTKTDKRARSGSIFENA